MEEMQKQLTDKQMNEMNVMQKQMMEVNNIKQMLQKHMNEMNGVKCGPRPFGTTHNATAVNLPGLPTPPLLPAANEGMHTPLQEGRGLTSEDLETPGNGNPHTRKLQKTAA